MRRGRAFYLQRPPVSFALLDLGRIILRGQRAVIVASKAPFLCLYSTASPRLNGLLEILAPFSYRADGYMSEVLNQLSAQRSVNQYCKPVPWMQIAVSMGEPVDCSALASANI